MSKQENRTLPFLDEHDAVVLAGIINRSVVRLDDLPMSLEEATTLFMVLDRIMKAIFDQQGNALLYLIARAHNIDVPEKRGKSNGSDDDLDVPEEPDKSNGSDDDNDAE